MNFLALYWKRSLVRILVILAIGTMAVWFALDYASAHDFFCSRWAGLEGYNNNYCLVNYIDRFQTLIGAVVAVMAAFLTVQEMRRSDKEEQKRHRESLHASTLSERQRIKEYSFKISYALWLSKEANNKYGYHKDNPKLAEYTKEKLYDLLQDMRADMQEIFACMNHPHVTEIEIMLPGEEPWRVTQIRNFLLFKKSNYPDSPLYVDRENIITAAGHLIEAHQHLSKLSEESSKWIRNNLRAMGEDVIDQ